MIDHAALAAELHRAAQNVSPVGLLTDRHPDLSWADARAVARATDSIRRDAGNTQIGWKLGWTSEAMRTALGIDRPNWGTLWDSQVVDGSITRSAYLHPKIEPELVWRSPIDLPAQVTAPDVAAIGGEWALGIEVVDPRFPSYDFHALDNTADNSSSAAVGVGTFAPLDIDVDELEVTFSSGTDTRTGPGSQAMGSPFEAIAWLARSLGDERLIVRTGDIIFTGGLTAPFDAMPGATYLLVGHPLAPVELEFV